jgi:hypothetical protein
MTKFYYLNLELGKVIDETRLMTPVNGKILSIAEVSKVTGMSENTYMSVKKGILTVSGTATGSSIFTIGY